MTKTEQRKRDRKLIPKKPWPARPQDHKILSSRTFKVGYRVDIELVDNLECMGRPRRKYTQDPGRFMIMRTARTLDGNHYIGDPRWAHRIFVTRHLTQVQPSENGQACCIGFNKANDTWCGWSHRAMCSFGRGDKIFEENWKQATDQTPFREHGGRTIKTIPQAKKAALAFAEYVS